MNKKERKKKMNGAKAFFIDIDGTLTAKRFEIPDENIAALIAAQARGHKVFINTGRSRANIPDYLMGKFSFANGIICGNGCHFIAEGRDVFADFIPGETVSRVAEYFFDHREKWCVIEGEKKLFIVEDEGRTRDDLDGKIILKSRDEYRTRYYDEPIEVIAWGRGKPDEFAAEFKDELDVFYIGSYCDCVKKGCNKSKGMLRVLDLIGFSPEQSVAIGDSENDRGMMEAAGFAIAMGNAPESIKSIADYVTCSNLELGVAKAVDLLF